VNLFKVLNKKNKRYNYTPRYYSGKSNESPYSFESKFEKYRDINNKNDYRGSWEKVRLEMRNRKNASSSPLLIVIFFILLIIFLIFIDFDLSIFFRNN